MKLKRLRKIMGCLMLTGAMVLAVPQITFAAASTQMNNISEKSSEAEEHTEPVTEKATEHMTETSTQTESETESESMTESESESESETESELDSETEPESESDSEQTVIGLMEDDDEKEIENPDEDETQEDHSDANANLTSNIIAGNGIYLNELSGTYYLKFEDDFEQVMDEIEGDFSHWLESPEEFRAMNWQDILAVYVLKTRETTGDKEITLGAESKEELEKIFFMMNIRSDSSMANKLTKEIDLSKEICSLTVEDYVELRNLSEEEREILEKYASQECRKLCAVVTASKGFVRSEVGEGVSEERVSIVAAACSLVGKVGYFWGGKSYAIGWDSLWGNPMTVTAGGSKSSGTSRSYGLDCSGFVCWSYYNGLSGTDGGIGNHTTTQWNASAMVESADAQPGDMVFYNSPIAGDQNHVGLVIGKNEDGSLLVAHCSSSQNGVVVGEAWASGFKYVRSPLSLD